MNDLNEWLDSWRPIRVGFSQWLLQHGATAICIWPSDGSLAANDRFLSLQSPGQSFRLGLVGSQQLGSIAWCLLHEGVATAAQHEFFGDSDLRNEVVVANRRCDAFERHAEHAGNLLLEAPPQLGIAASKECAGYRGVKLWIASLFAEADQPPEFRIRSQPYRPLWCDALTWPHGLQMLKDDPFAASVVLIDWLRGAAERTLAAKPVEVSTRGFEVKAERISDELARLADLLDLIANDEADEIKDGDGWQIRTDAGLHVARLQALLNYGDLDFADCDFPTLQRLKGLWSSIKRLDFGDHSDAPREYRGALFLPHELRPLQIGPNESIPNQVLRGADEPYDAYEGFGKHWSGYEAARKIVAEQFPNAKLTETKREAWRWYPDKLRSYSESLAKPGNAQPAAEQVASEVREADERSHRSIEQESPVPDSRPISKKVAARLHRGAPVANPTSYFNDLVAGNHLTAPVGSGQRWRFVVEEFPEPVRDQMR